MIVEYQDNGFVCEREIFSESEIDQIKVNVEKLAKSDLPGNIYEEDGKTIRGLHGLHLYDEFFLNLVKDERITSFVAQALGAPFYVHQFKVNMKRGLTGQFWPWHEDFSYWKNKDGISSPDMINVAVLLDNTEHLSGPLCLIPGSHKWDDVSRKSNSEDDWRNDLSSKMTYQIDNARLDEMLASNGVEIMTGERGDVLFFNPLLAHCSSVNLSTVDRALMIITYNTVSNKPDLNNPNKRPNFLCSDDFESLN